MVVNVIGKAAFAIVPQKMGELKVQVHPGEGEETGDLKVHVHLGEGEGGEDCWIHKEGVVVGDMDRDCDWAILEEEEEAEIQTCHLG